MGNPLSTVANLPIRNFDEVTEAVMVGFNAESDPEVSNHPCEVGTLIVFPSSNKKYGVVQVVTSNTGQTYARSRWGSWAPWQRLDNFGYNTLEELAAALKPLM